MAKDVESLHKWETITTLTARQDLNISKLHITTKKANYNLLSVFIQNYFRIWEKEKMKKTAEWGKETAEEAGNEREREDEREIDWNFLNVATFPFWFFGISGGKKISIIQNHWIW
jgi:hypothetical protein